MRLGNISRALSSICILRHLVILHSFRETLRLKKKPGLPDGSIVHFPLSFTRDLRLFGHLFWQRKILRSKLPVFAETYNTPDRLRALGNKHSDQRYDLVFAFKTVMAPYALHLKESGIAERAVLDIDDIESETLDRFSQLAGLEKQPVLSRQYKELAWRYREFENQYFPGFDLLYVCSGVDREKLAKRFPDSRIEILPNAVEMAGLPVREHRNRTFTFGFIGTLGYLPNRDAVSYFCKEILPIIRGKSQIPFQVLIAGTGLPNSLKKELKHIPECTLPGGVDDVDAFYGNVDAVIVPIRTGGGTRIKILEAFAHNRPVVATAIGIEGIEAVPDTHFLLGDSAEDFAAQCVEIMGNKELGSRLVENALTLVKREYGLNNVAAVLRDKILETG
jgi:glycosyltransferase involved in cell wall biosynthesis